MYLPVCAGFPGPDGMHPGRGGGSRRPV